VKGGIGVSGQGRIPGEVRQRRGGRRRSHPRGVRVNQSVDGAACGEVCVALQLMCSKRRNRNILTKKNISDTYAAHADEVAVVPRNTCL
jgi:hypothetical protein